MKSLITAILLASSMASAFAQTIIYEEQTTTTKKLIIINGGMEVEHGQTPIAIPQRRYSAGKLGIGDKVITSDNRDGVVKSMFIADQKIVVYDSYYGNRTWSLDKVAVSKGCVGAICVGDKVITSDNRDGSVVGYFADGKVVVYDSYYGNRTWSSSSIALAFGCTDLLCAGDKVITSDNRDGVVKAFFGNGKVAVYDSYYGNRTWNDSSISVTTGICTNIYTQRTHFCN